MVTRCGGAVRHEALGAAPGGGRGGRTAAGDEHRVGPPQSAGTRLDGSKKMLLDEGLSFPGGLIVRSAHEMYVTNCGVCPDAGEVRESRSESGHWGRLRVAGRLPPRSIELNGHISGAAASGSSKIYS